MQASSSKLTEFVKSFSDDLELVDPSYTGKHEGRMVFYFLLLFGFWQVLLFEPGLSLFENVLNGSLQLVSFSPILLIATKPGDEWMKWSVKKTYALDVVLFVIGFYGLYFFIGDLLNLQLALEYSSKIQDFVFEGNFWLNYLFLMTCVFFFVRFPFYVLDLREETKKPLDYMKDFREHASLWVHFIVLCVLGIFLVYGITRESFGMNGLLLGLLVIPLFLAIFFVSQHPKLKYNARAQDNEKSSFTFSDFFGLLFLAPSLLIFSELPFSGTWPLLFFAIAMIYGTRNGREHHYYSYVPQSSRDLFEYIDMILISFVIFIPLGILVQFIDLNNFTLDVNFPDLYGAFCTWTFYVGITEEILFRCGLLILVSDYFRHRDVNRHKTWALVVASVLFGLGHATKGWNYCFLAIIAGFAYGILFLKGRNMLAPVLLHMTVDVVAVMFFGASL